MTRKYILSNTLTSHFIYFAKLMGIYPKLYLTFRDLCDVVKELGLFEDHDINFFSEGSFGRFINLSLRRQGVILNEDFVRHSYFLGNYALKRFTNKEIDELIDLFFIYLKDKKIYKYIRIDEG